MDTAQREPLEEGTVQGHGTRWGRRLVVLSLLAAAAGAAALVFLSHKHPKAVQSGRQWLSRRSQVAVDLGWDEKAPDQLPVAPPAKPIDLVELGEGEDEDGTHTFEIGHGGVEFGVEEDDDIWGLMRELGSDSNGVPMLNADHLMAESNPDDDGRHHTFFVCHQHHDISTTEAMQITKVEPIVTKVPSLNFDDSVVHHMSIFLCTEGESRFGNIGRCEEGPHPVVPHDTMHRPCYRMAYAHDRDAVKFTFPKDAGIRIGKGTPYTRIVQEWHYLLPKNGLQGKRFVDRTRFKVTTTKNLRPKNVAMMGLMNMKMNLPPGRERVHHHWECNAHRVRKMLKNDFEKFGNVSVMAVHLHAHNRAKTVWWDHLRDGKKIGEFGRFPQYQGYGPDESFMLIDPKQNEGRGTNPEFQGITEGTPGREIRPGDSLRTNCYFDTRDRTEPTVYGTNHGEEMCGFLMMYYPHDFSRIKHHEDTCIDEFPIESEDEK